MKRIVVKVGTSTITYENGEINYRNIELLARTLSGIHNMGIDVVLVTSGAISVGQNKMRLAERPEELKIKQAAAAVGQCELMHIYDKFFGEYGQIVAQMLLVGEDIELPGKKQNIINTFCTLLEMGIIPIVNENDSVSHTEIESDQKVFGDNDTLSAYVTVLCDADMLVLMSDIDGLFDADPKECSDSRVIHEVRVIDDTIRNIASGAGSSRGTGGMLTKLDAAEIVMKHGKDMIITNGNKPEALYEIVDGQNVGTLFAGKKL